eukprot:gnl/TRDRNA2_/TRDRNA2_44519_c0_seq1.p1 gnl/TRDRNA2_/TRDRNA2_44519_c0~~gnl/TRDRNA2_/TRDRNA2_44519_c0_seq1.p1  ORF type:complete len:268 (-),score=42.42 gnl/TRDRNA2_/TRDRNA2_44519_c0_seq1:184-987(-)
MGNAPPELNDPPKSQSEAPVVHASAPASGRQHCIRQDCTGPWADCYDDDQIGDFNTELGRYGEPQPPRQQQRGQAKEHQHEVYVDKQLRRDPAAGQTVNKQQKEDRQPQVVEAQNAIEPRCFSSPVPREPSGAFGAVFGDNAPASNGGMSLLGPACSGVSCEALQADEFTVHQADFQVPGVNALGAPKPRLQGMGTSFNPSKDFGIAESQAQLDAMALEASTIPPSRGEENDPSLRVPRTERFSQLDQSLAEEIAKLKQAGGRQGKA